MVRAGLVLGTVGGERDEAPLVWTVSRAPCDVDTGERTRDGGHGPRFLKGQLRRPGSVRRLLSHSLKPWP